MKTRVLVFSSSEDYIDQISKLLRKVKMDRVYFMDDALEAIKKDTPDIIILHVKYETKAITDLRINGFKGLIIADGPPSHFAKVDDFDVKTNSINGAANVTIAIAQKIQFLLNRWGKGRKTLIKDLNHYVAQGLTRIETIIFLNNPSLYLALKVAGAKVHR